MGYNQIIFNSLAARKAIFIEGIGVVSVVRKGSVKSNPKRERDFPRYYMVLSKADKSKSYLSLKEAGVGDYKAWLRGVTKDGRGGRKIVINGCFTLRLKGDGRFRFDVSPELDMLLNPFSDGKKRALSPSIIIASLVVVLACSVVLILFLIDGGYIRLPERDVEVAQQQSVSPVVGVIPEIEYINDDDSTASDSLASDSTVTVVVGDSVAVGIAGGGHDVKVSGDVSATVPTMPECYRDPIKGNFYLIVSSFRTLSMARKDSTRIAKIVGNGVKVLTTRKMDGNYINYIFTSKSEEDVIAFQIGLNSKYEQLSGIWVYEMR